MGQVIYYVIDVDSGAVLANFTNESDVSRFLAGTDRYIVSRVVIRGAVLIDTAVIDVSQPD